MCCPQGGLQGCSNCFNCLYYCFGCVCGVGREQRLHPPATALEDWSPAWASSLLDALGTRTCCALSCATAPVCCSCCWAGALSEVGTSLLGARFLSGCMFPFPANGQAANSCKAR